jgi:hypothetical protein
MDIGIERQNWRFEAGTAADLRPDWQGLRARLAAAHAARAACAHLAQSAVSGSFDRLSARSVATFPQDSEAVNPIALGYGKPVESIREEVAGPVLAGDRG